MTEEETPPTRAEVHADARERAKRTWWQSLIAAIIVGALAALSAAILGMTQTDMLDASVWIATGGLVLHAGLTAGASWLQRTLEGRRLE